MKIVIKWYFLVSMLFLTVLATPPAVNAVELPEFYSCSAPSGEVIANYNEGIHGIVGETTEYRGQDTVYKINDAQIVQCFCPDNQAQGIQTLWWKFSDTNQADLNVLQKQGWIYVPNGKLWGLDDAPYIARNSRFICRGSGGAGSILGITGFADTGSQFPLLAIAIAGLLSVTFWKVGKRRK